MEAKTPVCREPALPRSILACLPFLWSRVLFPGNADQDGSQRWLPILILLIVPAALLYPCMSFYLFEPDEGRYAQIPREMLQADEWLVPLLQNEPYLDKPPLFYWLVMGSYWLFGISEWSARFVPALAIHGCVLLTYFLGRRSLGAKAAWWGALILALSPAFVSMGKLLILDGVLAFWVTLSIFCAFEAVRGPVLGWNWWFLSAIACGLGILTKGPVALVLLVPPLWLQRRLTGQAAPLTWRAILAFTATVILVALPWYLAVCLRLPQFAGHFLWEHNLLRFLMPFDHQRPIWFYGPILVAGMLPASLLLFPFLRFLGSGREEIACRRSPELGFMLLAGGWCVLFFSLSGCKLPTYILPAFPFLALALGAYLTHSRWQKSLLTHGAVVGMFAVLLVGHYKVIPDLARFRSPMAEPQAVLESCRDRTIPVICYPRPIDSAAFYLGRNDLRSYRSKETPELIRFMQDRPVTVVLFAHRHSLQQLREVLPPGLGMIRTAPMGLCHMAVVSRSTGSSGAIPKR
jgi:4-amino-4-deoxy-L-arabinose transferase-like glycosyltransferase